MIRRVIGPDLKAARRARIFGSFLVLVASAASATWPRSLAWLYLAVSIFLLLSTTYVARRGLPTLEIYSDKIVLKQWLSDDITLSRGSVAVFATLELKHGPALVAFGEPLPLSPGALALGPRKQDTVFPRGLELSLPELEQLMSQWLIAEIT